MEKENHIREYAVALEHTRADLWGVNEELRKKIGALERGQDDLINALRSSLEHSTCTCELCVHTYKSIRVVAPPPPLGMEHFNGS